MAKTLVIDGQILQTSAWFRGMGKYTLQVMSELSAAKPDGLDLMVLFNDNLECDHSRFDTIMFLCPNVKQLRYRLPLASDRLTTAVGYKEALNEALAGVGQSEKSYLITGPFYFDFYAEFPDGFRKLMLFYDLTPLLFWKDLGGYFPPELYLQRFQKVLETDRIFAISETTRQDLLRVLGLPPENVVNINGGFTKIAEKTKKPASFEVPRDYLLFPTGDLPHKNNEVAIKGFEEYCRRHAASLTLLVTSNFRPESKERLGALSDKVVFTGNVSDEELEWLYEHAKAILFASKYEGLGLPILDAVASKVPVIASRIPVFEEMSRKAFYYFRYDDADGLAEAIETAVERNGFNGRLKLYPAIIKKYTWQNTVRNIVDNLSLQAQVNTSKRLRLAVVCLHPGIAGQIGRLAESLHYSLSRRFDVDYYFDANGYHYREIERPTFLDTLEGHSFDITHLTRRSAKCYRTLVYLLDEAAIPSRAAQRAVALPGIAITGCKDRPLDEQSEMFKNLALDSQNRLLEAPTDYQGFTKLADQIADAIIGKGDNHGQ